jgi:PhnB protein
MSPVKPIPDAFPVLTPMLVCHDASGEMEFCRTVFGAVELNRRFGPDGSVAHGLLAIGGSMIMIESEWPGVASRAPEGDGSSPVILYLYVEDVDAVVASALGAGATLLWEVQNRFWGDRTGRILDPSGHVWTISTRIEETSADERSRRWSEIVEEGEA